MSKAENDRRFHKWLRECWRKFTVRKGSIVTDQFPDDAILPDDGFGDTQVTYNEKGGLVGLAVMIFSGRLAYTNPSELRGSIGRDSAVVFKVGHGEAELGDMPPGFDPDVDPTPFPDRN